MRIVFLSPTGQMGGAETALVELLAGLRESHPSWSLQLIVASDGPLVGRVEDIGVPAHVLPFPPSLARLGDWALGSSVVGRLAFLTRCAVATGPTMRYLARLRHALGTGAAVVHTNGFKMHVLGALARPRGSAVLWHIHDYISPRRVMTTLLRRVLGRCSAIVANSHSVASDVRDALGSDITIYPVWNAVDLNRFRSAGPQLDLDALSELASAGNVLRVGLVATFARWKGHQTFLTALSLLPSSLPVRGYIIGGPVYETAGSQVSIDELRRHATALGLESRVGFTGFVEDTAAAMRSLDVVVHASTEPEPFGLVIAEAMACRKPIVVSRAGGAMEIAQPLVNAMAHEPGNARDLARCLERLANEPALRQRIADAGRATAEKAFTRQRLALEMTSIYESMASAN